MRVMLINSNRFKQPWPVIPFGLCCIAAALENAGHTIQVLDLCFSSNPASDIRSTIKDFQPDAVGISIRNIDNAIENKTIFLLDRIREEVIIPCQKAFTGPIIIGGAAVGISGAQMLHFFNLKYAIGGDGETAMVECIERLEKKLPLDGLRGLIRREGGKIIEENPPLRVQDLDGLPSVKFHRYVDLHRYHQFDSPIQIQTKRGCALQCTYCTYNRLEGREYRFRTPHVVADEIERLVSETGINHIEFVDSTFNIPLDHTKAVLRSLEAKGLDIRCTAMGLNPGAVDEELVDLMKRVGFQEVDLGVESGSSLTLQSLKKGFTKEDVVRAGRLLREKNISIAWCLLVGAPGETKDTLKETFDTIRQAASQWDIVAFNVGIRAYNGSPIAEDMKQEDPACTHDSFLQPVYYSPQSLDLNTIRILTKRAFFRNTNFMLAEDYNHYPAVVIKAVNAILKLIAPNQPIWRMYILERKLLKCLGLNAISSFLFDLKHRKVLLKLKVQ